MGVGLLCPGLSFLGGLGADVVVGPSDGATVGDFSEGLLGALLGSGLVSGSSLSVGPNEGESVGSMSSVVGSIVEGSSVVGSMVEGLQCGSRHDICVS